MSKRILITAGGTGGHVYPAQGLAQQLAKQPSSPQVLFVAGCLATNKYFDRSSFAFREVTTSPLVSRNPLKTLKGFVNLARGVWQSIQVMKEFKPDVVVGFGSYYTVPTLLAAKCLRIPIILHEANSIPGKANKWLSMLAWRIGVHFPATKALLKGDVVEVGMPLREGYQKGRIEKASALDYFQLDHECPTLLIFGGSQGAQAINRLMKGCSEKLKASRVQFIHFTGDARVVDEFKSCYEECGIKACVKPFENHMHLAWHAADLFIGRSGASTIAEAMEFEVPGILIPYPHATDQHQDKNANFFVATVGGGVKYAEAEATDQVIADVLLELVQVDRLNEMKKALAAYKQRPNRITLCELVLMERS